MFIIVGVLLGSATSYVITYKYQKPNVILPEEYMTIEKGDTLIVENVSLDGVELGFLNNENLDYTDDALVEKIKKDHPNWTHEECEDYLFNDSMGE